MNTQIKKVIRKLNISLVLVFTILSVPFAFFHKKILEEKFNGRLTDVAGIGATLVMDDLNRIKYSTM